MKKNYYLFFAIFILTRSVLGQNYQTVQSSGEFFFADSTGYVKAIRIANASVNGTDSVFNNFSSRYDTVPLVLAACSWVFGPSWIGGQVIIRNDGFNIFFNVDSDSIFINAHANVLDTWTLYTYHNGDYIEAKEISADTATFGLINDSVKTFSLQTKDISGNNISNPLNGREIKLSKDHGFVQLPAFIDFPADAGLDYTRVDAHRLTIRDVYDYAPGDKFYYYYDNYNQFGQQMGPPDYSSALVLSKSFSPANDTVFYVMEETYVAVDVDWNPSPHIVTTVSVTTDTVHYTNLDSVLFNNYMPEESMADTISALCYTYYTMTLDGCQKRIKEKIFGGYYLCYDIGSGCFMGAFEPALNNYTYGEGLGQTDFLWDNTSQSFGQANIISMTSYVKGNDTCGQAIDLAVTELEAEDQIKIYPNPATNEFEIQNLKSKIEKIEIFNVLGEKCLTLNPSPSGEGLRVDVSSLAPGVYFVNMVGEKGSVTQKIVVQR